MLQIFYLFVEIWFYFDNKVIFIFSVKKPQQQLNVVPQ